MSDEMRGRFSLVLSTIRDNGDLRAMGRFSLTKGEAAAIETFGVENFRRLLNAKLAEQVARVIEAAHTELLRGGTADAPPNASSAVRDSKGGTE